ncbi:hypothetical protein PVAND_015781 [Polypedilum vanderplanki]|uniref:Folliculin n=1 Tax=Polypedilum vanderplanki TaxID=319348 RepID=A0A9J6BD85_POLVA|nr:hypothetical protein PVAND_015781 [Polypedilum vanderplanki]
MNAIINLNHFCEVHGPQSIFSTQTIRDKSLIQKISLNSNNNNGTSQSQKVVCEGCSSIGDKMVFVSEENSIFFVSSEKSIFGKDHQGSLKQTALKSLCEITANNQENLVFFGDARLNSLCYSFKVKDSFARGFETLFSITIVMKDKMFLLNTQPFLADNIKEIAKRMQDSALKVYESEQKQFSQRAERLNSGKMSDLQPRSLRELVGEQNIFAHLHSLFSWILYAGSRYFTEVLTLGSSTLPAFARKEAEGFAFISIDKEEFLMQNFSDNSEYDSSYSLRHLKEQVTVHQFNQLIYCSLVGIQIVIRGYYMEFNNYFKEFLPQAFHRFIFESSKYVSAQKCRILTLPADATIPSHNNICRIDFIDDHQIYIKCNVDIPSKPPALMTKILNAVDEKLFSNHTMYKFVQALVEEWKNKIICLSHQHDHDVSKLKKVLGIQQNDELLVSYWLSVL